MDNTLLLSPSLTLDFRSPDLHSQDPLASPSSPLMLSPLSPNQSPRVSFASVTQLQSYPDKFLGSYSSYNTQFSPDSLSPGPDSATSSEDAHSPLDNPSDVDFDNMAEFDYPYPLSFSGTAGSGYGAGDMFHSPQMSMHERKPRPIEITSGDGEGISVASPYVFASGGLPFISGNFKQDIKQEYYSPTDSDMGVYNYMTVRTPEHPSAPAYTYASSPESSFLDSSAYYSPPASAHAAASLSVGAHHSAYSIPSHTGHSGHVSAGAGQGGCDPRFVSGSPPDLDFRSRMIAGSGPNASSMPVRFTGAFGSVDADADADAEGEEVNDDRQEYMYGNQDANGEEERTDDDNDSDYIDSNNKRHLRSGVPPLVVPSQAARVTALTTPVVGSSSMNLRTLQSSRDSSVMRMQRPSAPPPVPVPNLTKKSRGRRVPTNPGVVVSSDGSARRTRGYTCRVAGCGKCFARGEHLKRHVRSIHTNDKPHKCPHPGCGKEFSRHDNLCQHMRVHRNFSAPRDGGHLAV